MIKGSGGSTCVFCGRSYMTEVEAALCCHPEYVKKVDSTTVLTEERYRLIAEYAGRFYVDPACSLNASVAGATMLADEVIKHHPLWRDK